MKRIVFSELAVNDQEETLDFYVDQEGPDLAVRYLQALQKAVLLLAAEPNLGSPRRFQASELQGIRWLALPTPFQKHLVFYRVARQAIEIIRVLHASRNIEAILKEKQANRL